jgi:methylmalonyl-CoA decarboxylase subunit alpha
MGAEGMLGIAGIKLFGGMEPPPEVKAQLLAKIRDAISIYKSGGWGALDDIIDPRETRERLFRGLELSWNKKMERPYRKHGIVPV